MVQTIRNIQLLAQEFNNAYLTNVSKSRFCFPIYVYHRSQPTQDEFAVYLNGLTSVLN